MAIGSSMTELQVEVVRKVYASGALFSFVGGAIIIMSFLFVKRLRTMTTFLVFMLAISCLGSAIFNSFSWFIYDQMVPGNSLKSSKEMAEVLCRIQGGGMQFFALSSFLWISCLAVHAFNILCRKKSKETLRSYFKFYFAICYFIPAITVLVCLLTDSLGETEGKVWCWITQERQSVRFAVYYIPLIILWIFNATIYILLSRESHSSLSYGYLIKEGKRRLRLYILVFVISKFPALINRICNLFLSEEIFVLFLLQALFDSLFGFFESLVYIALVKKRAPSFCCNPKTENNGLGEPLIHETTVPYSSIAERMYYTPKLSSTKPNIIIKDQTSRSVSINS